MFDEEKLIDIQESAEKDSWSCVRYRVITAPLITDREQVTIVNLKFGNDGKVFICTKSINDDRFPVVKNKIRVFINEHFELYETIENGENITVLNGTSFLDLKGHIPPSRLNMATANNIFKFN